MERKPYIPEYLEMILEQMKELNQIMREVFEEKENKEETIEDKEETIEEKENKEEIIVENAPDKPTTKKTKKHRTQ